MYEILLFYSNFDSLFGIYDPRSIEFTHKSNIICMEINSWWMWDIRNIEGRYRHWHFQWNFVHVFLLFDVEAWCCNNNEISHDSLPKKSMNNGKYSNEINWLQKAWCFCVRFWELKNHDGVFLTLFWFKNIVVMHNIIRSNCN